MNFEPQSLRETQTRAVQVADVDADGWLDIVFSRVTGVPGYWHNSELTTNGRAEFEVAWRLPGVTYPAYALTWGDPDHDGDLDLVTGSYDAELRQRLGNAFMFGPGGGVVYYEQNDGQFTPTRLSDESQTLALWLSDVNGDGDTDLLVGNDFTMPDQSWSYAEGMWRENVLFDVTTLSTMSFDLGDINNDGRSEFFATDMKPFSDDPVVLSAWQPVLDSLTSIPLQPDDPQIMENVLQVSNSHGGYENHARDFGIDATGWSWSAKFGDLDNDGFLDLYVVNGMIAFDVFAHLPGAELVEANQAFHNESGPYFTRADSWGLDSTASGRGMSVADIDNDGDLDIVVNNLSSSARLFENQLCGGAGLQVDLRWPGSENAYALSATLVLYTDSGTYYRDVRSGSGYLSGDPSRAHFGFPRSSQLEYLEIYWPDGEVSSIPAPPANSILTVTRPDS